MQPNQQRMLAIVLLIIAVTLLMSATGIMVYTLNSRRYSHRKPGAESRDQFGNEGCSPPISPDAVRANIAIQRTQAIQVIQMTQTIQTSLKTHQSAGQVMRG